MITSATGADDPDLADTTWPLPDQALSDALARAYHGEPTRADLLVIARVAEAYRALVVDGVCHVQKRRLAALRRVYRRRFGT